MQAKIKEEQFFIFKKYLNKRKCFFNQNNCDASQEKEPMM